MDDRDIFIVGAARTAIGDFGGALKDVQPDELGRIVAVAAMERAAVAPADVQHVVIGQVIQSGPRDAYIARVIGVNAGIPVEAPALTLNRLCGSGLQAIISAAQTLKLGEADIALAGGTESMSNSPHVVKAARFGTKMGDIKMIDAMLEVLSDPFEHFHMGITAENVAEKYQVSRAAQDALAVEGHSRAARAIAEGRFKEQIVPVEVKSRKGVVTFDTDEHVRADASLEEMAKLKPAFRKEGGTVTPGNASGINDGAGAVVVASGKAVAEKGLKPLARILGWGHAGVDPRIMGVGPIKAVPIALERAGVTLDQIDVIEANEAFAAQACAVAKELGFDPEKVNPNGSGIALGHPVGATGAILTVKTAYELKRTGGRYGLITMCIGGGQGIAMVIENVA
ncbi:beta-ketothiolase BktB [Sphingobium baderi]|uniref:3-ketoacyl-CoA thiolase n=1 Tax=Sphingobium baderi LL03 TaxID=1114964 RepID=T0GBH0_9SPHN|nr:beta-ketothiolase BktB [Sphingobium baderi]EQA98001.1 3-ketoacyl-CoA thiolase [Sphingobium baderi LL03]KMS63598.1 3-ketoacyl-CoA thiolase [Sphingobium baderi LL03]WRD77411.1 beta-ketothiolase BktB [Sphingobium baderi]